jgi:hypothetical protein
MALTVERFPVNIEATAKPEGVLELELLATNAMRRSRSSMSGTQYVCGVASRDSEWPLIVSAYALSGNAALPRRR